MVNLLLGFVIISCDSGVNDELKGKELIGAPEVQSTFKLLVRNDENLDEIIKKDLVALPVSLLKVMQKKRANREKYVRGMFADRKLGELVSAAGLDKDLELNVRIKGMINKVYIESLTNQYFESVEKDLAVLARDRYLINKKDYKKRRKIRLAQIFISKYEKDKQEAQKIVDMIVTELAKEDSNFFELADKFSDDRENTRKGGIYDKWLIAPKDISGLGKVLAAGFALTNVGDESDVIETKKGYHFLKLIQETPEVEIPFKVVRERLIKQLEKELYQEAKKKIRQSIYPPNDFKYNDELLEVMIKAELNK